MGSRRSACEKFRYAEPGWKAEAVADQSSIIVNARWDQDTGLFAASSSDIDGLAIEAATFEELREKVLSTIPELIELNGVSSATAA
ncbi:MAG: DUF1902 domain-containing protein [Hyphomicrobiaceae bacterium]